MDILELAQYYMPGELAENPALVEERIETARAVLQAFSEDEEE